MTDALELRLPEPPSPNRRPQNLMQEVREKNRYKRKAWAKALSQALPTTDPPSPVLISAHFRLRNKRDPDNLVASLKYVLDALRLPSESETFDWRQGIAVDKGFFRDDNPRDMALGDVTQEIDRANRGVSLRIAAVGAQ